MLKRSDKQRDEQRRGRGFQHLGAARSVLSGLVAIVLVVTGLAAISPAAPDPAHLQDLAHLQGPTHFQGPVRPGIDVLLSGDLAPIRGARVGLITNHTGVGAGGESSIDLLHARPEFELVALFSPEHGIRGTAEAGERVESGRDGRTGLPIHSLYGETRKPTPEMLEGIDVLLFDIQDIGTRYYTYVWTMALALEAAAENDVRMIVLDRPNPIGGDRVQGNVLDPAFASFVGLHAVPMRHGMTVGELALMLNETQRIGAELEVIRAEGWRRGQWYDQTGLAWIAPSPNMPSLESAAHYAGTCLFEGTNLSVGRGTSVAFQQIGAPWLDHEALVETLEGYGLEGVRFEPVVFTPTRPGDGKFGGEAVRGVRFTVTDRDRYDPTITAVATLIEIQRLHGERLNWHRSHFDRLAGTSALREGILAGAGLEELTADWPEQLGEFERLRRGYGLY